MMYREISDEFWNVVEPLLAPFRQTKSGGSPPLDFRLIVNGIFYVLKTGCQWSMLPQCYGSKSTVHEHFQRWVHAGVWAELFRRYAQAYQDLNGIQWDWQAIKEKGPGSIMNSRNASRTPKPARTPSGSELSARPVQARAGLR